MTNTSNNTPGLIKEIYDLSISIWCKVADFGNYGKYPRGDQGVPGPTGIVRGNEKSQSPDYNLDYAYLSSTVVALNQALDKLRFVNIKK